MQTIAIHLANRALPKKQSESTPAHGTVAAALSRRHHQIIRLGATPFLVYCSHSKLGHGAYSSQNPISTFVFRVAVDNAIKNLTILNFEFGVTKCNAY